MFVQVIRGKVKDAAALRAATERWQKELRPGAKGFLGGTGGVADDGRSIEVIRFESQEAAEANSSRLEQGAWWDETSKLFEGGVEFHNCTRTAVMQGGGSADAGFVQIMSYRTKDADAILAMSKQFEEMGSSRPDILGGMTAVSDDNTVFDVIYFTSEQEARKHENDEMPAEMQEVMKTFGELVEGEVEYIDLREPWLD